MWTLLVACAAQPAPVAEIAPAPAAVSAPWALVGRASTDGLDTPSLSDGAASLGPNCATLNTTLRGDGPPCFVEVWRADGAPLRVERAGARLRFDGLPGRTTWSPIAGILASCLGDPLAVPPAGDPGGVRALDGGIWVLALSGQNPCALAGTLRLDATRDRAVWSGLTAGGQPWSVGGRELAQALLRAELRTLVQTRWPELDDLARDDARRALAEDPHPDARRLLELRR